MAVAGDREVDNGAVGDGGEYVVGEAFDGEFHVVAVEGGHALEEAAEVRRIGQVHRTHQRVVVTDDAECNQHVEHIECTRPLGEVHLAGLGIQQGCRLELETQLTREVSSADGVDQCPHRPRLTGLEPQRMVRGGVEVDAGERIVHHTGNRPEQGELGRNLG